MVFKKRIFCDILNASNFYIDLRKVLLYKLGFSNTHSLPLYHSINISFSLSNLDNSKLHLLFCSLNLLYELFLYFPYIYCGNYRWLSRGKSLGILLKIHQFSFAQGLLLIRSISIINQLRFSMTLKNIRLFRNSQLYFNISIPFFDITKSALVTNDWYFDWSFCLIFTLSTNVRSFRELRFLLKLLDLFTDQYFRGDILFRKLSLKKKKKLLAKTQEKVFILKQKPNWKFFNCFLLHFFFK
jgi:hypothetical protein